MKQRTEILAGMVALALGLTTAPTAFAKSGVPPQPISPCALAALHPSVENQLSCLDYQVGQLQVASFQFTQQIASLQSASQQLGAQVAGLQSEIQSGSAQLQQQINALQPNCNALANMELVPATALHKAYCIDKTPSSAATHAQALIGCASGSRELCSLSNSRGDICAIGGNGHFWTEEVAIDTQTTYATGVSCTNNAFTGFFEAPVTAGSTFQYFCCKY